jgi:hypothetical protein
VLTFAARRQGTGAGATAPGFLPVKFLSCSSGSEPGGVNEGEQFSRHGNVCAAVILSLSSLIIGACSSAPGEPAPVYMMGMAGTATHEPAAVAPAEPAMAPVALAAWTEPSATTGHTATDVIPLDDPPQLPATAPARPRSGAASAGAMLSEPAAVPSTLGASAAPAAAAAPAAPLPAASPATALAGREPSAAEEARAETTPEPAHERIAPAPARGDLVTAGTSVARGPAPYSRPSYYWP